jgi:hypothetical protein
MLALLRAQGFSLRVRIPTMKRRIPDAHSLRLPELVGHDL